jgi:hypothetical protein
MTEKLCSAAFLTEKQLAERQNRSVRSIQNDRVRKTNGVPFHVFGTSIRYSIDDVLAYESRARATSTSMQVQHGGNRPCSKQCHGRSVVIDTPISPLSDAPQQAIPSSYSEGNS